MSLIDRIGLEEGVCTIGTGRRRVDIDLVESRSQNYVSARSADNILSATIVFFFSTCVIFFGGRAKSARVKSEMLVF